MESVSMKMKNKLMYVGVTHETAPVEVRAYYALSKEQKRLVIDTLKNQFHIDALTLVTTCNRTEIYFESSSVTPYQVRDYLKSFVEGIHGVKLTRNSFLILDRTLDTVNHLLYVANGLRSAVIGDRQIINQVKEAYLEALKNKSQGSLLERAYQAVFRSHKRVLAESLYQKGSTSTAYTSLKMIEEHFGKEEMQGLSLLILGAGEIAEDVLRYLSKFKLAKVSIANRTHEKSERLARIYGIDTYDWKSVEANQLGTFDIVLSAVSNRKNLIHQVGNSTKRRLWIDLAMPSNISPSVQNTYNQVYNIDEVTEKVTAISQAQLEAIPSVERILKEELSIFSAWLGQGKVRAFLRSYKACLKKVIVEMTSKEIIGSMGVDQFEGYVEAVANRVVKKPAKTLNSLSAVELSDHQFDIMNNILEDKQDRSTY